MAELMGDGAGIGELGRGIGRIAVCVGDVHGGKLRVGGGIALPGRQQIHGDGAGRPVRINAGGLNPRGGGAAVIGDGVAGAVGRIIGGRAEVAAGIGTDIGEIEHPAPIVEPGGNGKPSVRDVTGPAGRHTDPKNAVMIRGPGAVGAGGVGIRHQLKGHLAQDAVDDVEMGADIVRGGAGLAGGVGAVQNIGAEGNLPHGADQGPVLGKERPLKAHLKPHLALMGAVDQHPSSPRLADKGHGAAVGHRDDTPFEARIVVGEIERAGMIVGVFDARRGLVGGVRRSQHRDDRRIGDDVDVVRRPDQVEIGAALGRQQGGGGGQRRPPRQGRIWRHRPHRADLETRLVGGAGYGGAGDAAAVLAGGKDRCVRMAGEGAEDRELHHPLHRVVPGGTPPQSLAQGVEAQIDGAEMIVVDHILVIGGETEADLMAVADIDRCSPVGRPELDKALFHRVEDLPAVADVCAIHRDVEIPLARAEGIRVPADKYPAKRYPHPLIRRHSLLPCLSAAMHLFQLVPGGVVNDAGHLKLILLLEKTQGRFNLLRQLVISTTAAVKTEIGQPLLDPAVFTDRIERAEHERDLPGPGRVRLQDDFPAPGAGRDDKLDHPLAVRAALADLTVNVQPVGEIGADLVLRGLGGTPDDIAGFLGIAAVGRRLLHDLEPDLGRHPLLLEAVPRRGGAALLLLLTFRHKDLVAGQKDIGILAQLLQGPVVGMVPDRFPEVPVSVGDARQTVTLADHMRAAHGCPLLHGMLYCILNDASVSKGKRSSTASAVDRNHPHAI